MDLSPIVTDELRRLLWDTILPIVLITVIALVLIALARRTVNGFVTALLNREATEGTSRDVSAVELQKRIKTLESFASNVITAFILLIALVMVLGELNFNIGPAIAGLGIVGIAVGFGSQSLVRDFFTGALILIENQFSKGDVVTIAGVTGTVEDFSLRRTTLRDLDGVMHTVPNGEIKVASNRTREWGRINLNIMVVYGTDIEHASAVVDEVGRSLATDPAWAHRVTEPPRVERIEAFGETGITLKVLGRVPAEDVTAASGELRKRLLAAFDANGIEIATPGRVVAPRPAPAPPPTAGPSQDDLSVGTD